MKKNNTPGTGFRQSTKGGPLVEYVILMAAMSVFVMLSLKVLGFQVDEAFRNPHAELDTLTSGTSVVSGEVVPDYACSGFACTARNPALVAKNNKGFCPPPGYTWSWDQYHQEWTLPGVAAQDPTLRLFIGGRVTTFEGPERTDIVDVPNVTSINWWGDYIGITLFIWDTWEWTKQFGPNDLQPPIGNGTNCSNVIAAADSTAGADAYAPYFTSSNSDQFLKGTPGRDNLDMNSGSYIGVIGFQFPDTIGDTTGDDIIIPGPGDDAVTDRGGADTYVYKSGDGNDSYTPNSSISNRDKVVLLDISSANTTPSGTDVNNAGLNLRFSNGQTLTLDFVFFGTSRRLQSIQFTDKTLVQDQIQDWLVESEKPPQGSSGTVKGTELADHYFHTVPQDGSYKIDNLDSGSTQDILTFTDQTFSGASLAIARFSPDLIIHTDDGDAVTIKNQFTTSPRWGVKTLSFTDTTPTWQQVRDRAANDAKKSGGTVYLTQYDENIVHTASTDPSFSFRSYSTLGETDTLTFTETEYANATFKSSGEDLLVFAGGDTIRIRSQFGTQNNARLEKMTFAGPSSITPTLQDQLDKAISDQIRAGASAIYLTRLDDNIAYDPATDSNITFNTAWSSSSDTDTFSTTAIWGNVLFSQSGSADLRIDFPNGKHITITSQLGSATNNPLQSFVFNGTPHTLADIKTRIANGG